jgi:gluconate 2-dehydrogenase subunit 3-like protein
MPPDPQAWRETLAALDEDAHEAHGQSFGLLPVRQQAALVQAVFDAGSNGRKWHGWPGSQVWSLWTRYACAAFYSHPWAWNEIGFGGPAYPRGYKNVGLDSRERWEVADSDDTDPATFAERVEEARRHHEQLTAGPSSGHGRTAARQGEVD